MGGRKGVIRKGIGRASGWCGLIFVGLEKSLFLWLFRLVFLWLFRNYFATYSFF